MPIHSRRTHVLETAAVSPGRTGGWDGHSTAVRKSAARSMNRAADQPKPEVARAERVPVTGFNKQEGRQDWSDTDLRVPINHPSRSSCMLVRR